MKRFIAVHQMETTWFLDNHGMWTDSKKHARHFASKKEAEFVVRQTPMRTVERKLVQIKETSR